MPIQKVQTARQRAADLISRFLGKPTGNAAEMAVDLLDDEIGLIVDAGEDREIARLHIKDVLSAAYDRRQNAAALAAAKQMQADTRRGACCRVLQEQAGLAASESLDLFAMLDADEQEIVLALAGELDTEETLLAVCKCAFERATFAEQLARRHEPEEDEQHEGTGDGEQGTGEKSDVGASEVGGQKSEGSEPATDDTDLETPAESPAPSPNSTEPSPDPSAPTFSPVEADPVKAADEAS